MVTKVCSKCGRAKPYDDFYWRNGLGLRSHCSSCEIRSIGEWRFHRGVDRSAVTVVTTETELFAALTQPVPFYAPPPQD